MAPFDRHIRLTISLPFNYGSILYRFRD